MSALPNDSPHYPTVSKHGVVTHVIVPIEEFERLAMHRTVASQPPSDEAIDAAIAIYNNPATQWHDGEEVLREILIRGVDQARRAIGLTQTQLAAQTGLTQSQISRIESNPDRASLGILKRIAEALASRTPQT